MVAPLFDIFLSDLTGFGNQIVDVMCELQFFGIIVMIISGPN
jgi:hypothetical protein